MSNLEKTLEFMRFLHEFQNVERIAPVIGHNRMENDAEHSYSLTMLAWYLADILETNFDKDLVRKYALVHDLVETYAGDTPVYTSEESHKRSKHKREQAALQKIKEQFPNFKELYLLIEEYEKKQTAESKFVYALDKLGPLLTIYLDSIQRESIQKKFNVTFQMIAERNDARIAICPELNEIWKEFRTLLEKNKKELFAPEQ